MFKHFRTGGPGLFPRGEMRQGLETDQSPSSRIEVKNAWRYTATPVIIRLYCVKLSLCFSFNWAPSHEGVLGEWRYNSTHSLTSALDGCEWSASRLGRFTPRERAPGTHWIGGWMGSRAILDAVMKRIIPSLPRESNPRTPIVQPVAQRYTDWAITALCLYCVMLSQAIHTSLWHSTQLTTGTTSPF
jgi:hypothetical protein